LIAKIVDNNRVRLIDVLEHHAPRFRHISIATGYWDLPGFALLQDALAEYDSIRLIIGQEPLPPYGVANADLYALDSLFPDEHIKRALGDLEATSTMREAAKTLKNWLEAGKLEVRIFRGNFLHAKTYVFGKFGGSEALGIIGSSNFTAAGLTRNLELNAVDGDLHTVLFSPTEGQPHGHLSWFEEVWSDPKTEIWNGKFTKLLDASPLGDLAFSEYHMYIKSLYELYSEELVDRIDLNQDIDSILYAFQARNAKLLQQKLSRSGVAILADSVGLGKTITAGAVLKSYLEDKDAGRVYVIAPASLTQQWTKELGEVFKLVSGFEVISLQDTQKIRQARELDQYAPVDLFIVDEAHNLRSGVGSRFDELLEWFSDNPESHVLLLTATPINNSLKDLKNQIQLGSKGKLHSTPVVYPTESRSEVIDFFEAIERLNKEVKSAITSGRQPDYDKVNKVMRQGLRPYLVRTTRSGIMKEFGGIQTADGQLLSFPSSINKPRSYAFDPERFRTLADVFLEHKSTFEGLGLDNLDLTWLLGLTQRTEHPLDALRDNAGKPGMGPKTPFEVVFAMLLTLGFAPYRPDVYRPRYYGKDVVSISFAGVDDDEKLRVSSQMSIHNMLRVTLLKRLESSQFALRVSLENYGKRISNFRALLDQGQIARIRDLDNVLEVFGEDADMDPASTQERLNDFDLMSADPNVFDLQAMRRDLERDDAIVKLLLDMCDALGADDDKLHSFAKLLDSLDGENQHGRKVLIFSYYADTIKYLQSEISKHVNIKNFEQRAGFVIGESRNQANDLAKRFSPVSKKASAELLEQGELDYLFATDVLSEGQNLQDCAIIVNFDLHWNPVRMIQRNGRVNRLGSKFDEVLIFNMHPDTNLNEYLSLVERLNNKIDQIKFSIGTDQSVLGEEANPKEFLDIYSPANDGVTIDKDDDAELLGEDEFVRDLREFDATASQEDRDIVQSIGEGKWGYLPGHAVDVLKASTVALALIRVTGRFNHNNESFKANVFIRRGEQYAPVTNFTALTALRVERQNSIPRQDLIRIDREEVRKKSNQLAKHHAGKISLYFKRTPKVNAAIGIYSQHQVVGSELDQAFDKVQTKQTLKRASQIVRLINKDHKILGTLSESTINAVERFIEHMKEYQTLGVTLAPDSIRGVLYFGR
jgi:ERCC4-related helicase